MELIRKITNQELLRELESRIKTHQIKEEEISQLLEKKKKQRLAEYEAAANDPEENEELEDWNLVENKRSFIFRLIGLWQIKYQISL